MKISVAMCTYNGEKYLEEQINSILSQTILPDEIIICDDCSTDNTKLVLKKFNNLLFKIHYNPVNLGYVRNFEKAIKLCTGDIIFLADQDDVWVNTKIATIVAVLNSSPDIYGVFTNAFVTDGQLNPMELSLWEYIRFDYKHFNIYTLFREGTVVTGATMAFKKEALEEVFPINHDFGHEEWMAYIMTILYPDGLAPINQKLIYYRQHSSQHVGVNLKRKNRGWYIKLRVKILGISVRHYKRSNTLSKLQQVAKHLEKFSAKPFYQELIEYIAHLEARINITENKSKVQRWKLIRQDIPRYLKFDNFITAIKDFLC